MDVLFVVVVPHFLFGSNWGVSVTILTSYLVKVPVRTS